MTLKFFPMFFMQKAGLAPVSISVLGVVSPVGVALTSLACQRLSTM